MIFCNVCLLVRVCLITFEMVVRGSVCCLKHTSLSRMVIVLLFNYVILWDFLFSSIAVLIFCGTWVVREVPWYLLSSESLDVWGSASCNVLFCILCAILEQLYTCHFSLQLLSVQLQMLFHVFSAGEYISTTPLHYSFCTVVNFYLK